MCQKIYVCAPYFFFNAGLDKLGGKGQTVDRLRREGVVCLVVYPRSRWASLEDHARLNIWSLLPGTLKKLFTPAFYVYQANNISSF